jgi:hypothetical protein
MTPTQSAASLASGDNTVGATGAAQGDGVGYVSELPATDLLVLDSCHSTWLFDIPAKRFRRILKGLDVDPAVAATDWRSYDRLELSEGSEAFVVLLNPAGTRRIRSWRHVDGCEQCEGEQTVELSLEEIRRLSHP